MSRAGVRRGPGRARAPRWRSPAWPRRSPPRPRPRHSPGRTRWCRSARPPSAPTRWRTPTPRSSAWPPRHDGGGLLARRQRRRHLQLRRRRVLRLGRRRSASTRPIVGMAATPDGGGYWLVAPTAASSATATPASSARPARCASTRRWSAWRPPPTAAATGWWRPTAASSATATPRFFGSAGALPLNAPVVGMAATPDGGGLLAGGGRRRHLQLRRRRVRGLGGRLAPRTPRSTGMAATPAAAATGWWPATAASSPTGDAPLLRVARRDGPARARWWAWRRAGGHGLLAGGRAPQPLAGKVVGIDPGHNGLNYSRAGRHRPAGVQRHRGRAVRHDGDGDRQRLHRGAVQLQRGQLPGGRPGGGGRHRRADPARTTTASGPA